jgi:hypothetical protein
MIVHSLTLLLVIPVFVSKSGTLNDPNSLNLFVITSDVYFSDSC